MPEIEIHVRVAVRGDVVDPEVVAQNFVAAGLHAQLRYASSQDVTGFTSHVPLYRGDNGSIIGLRENGLIQWHESQLSVEPVDEEGTSFLVTTGFLDRRNDSVEYFVEVVGDSYLLHDNGSTFNDLVMSGCDLSHGKRKELMERCLTKNGAKLVGGRLEIEGTAENLGHRQARFVQCIQDLNGLSFLTRSNVAQVFSNDVEAWVRSLDVRYEEED